MKPWVVVTSGPTSNSLGVVRAFGRRRVPVALVDLVDYSPARWSRFVSRTLDCRAASSDPRLLIGLLMEFAHSRSEPPVLIPTGDREAMLFSEYQEELSSCFRTMPSPLESLQLVLDKSCFYRKLGELGLPAPATWFPSGFDELKRLSENLEFPFLIKPASSSHFCERFGQKLFVIRDPVSLSRALRRLEGEEIGVVLQELVRADIYHEVSFLLGADSAILASGGFDRIRQFPPGFGTATYCRSAHREEADRLGRKLLGAIPFRGLLSIELLRDRRDGQFKVLEVNPRSTLQNRLVAAAGFDMEFLLYELLLGRVSQGADRYEEGIIWIDDLKNLVSRLLETYESGADPVRLPSAKVSGKVHSLFSLRDPAPVLSLLGQSRARGSAWVSSLRMVRQASA